MLKKMLVVSVAAAGLACSGAFAASMKAPSGPMGAHWGISLGTSFNLSKGNWGDGTLLHFTVPYNVAVSYTDFSKNFRVMLGGGLAVGNDGYSSESANPTGYEFKVSYDMLKGMSANNWMTYGIALGINGNGDAGPNGAGTQNTPGYMMPDEGGQFNFDASGCVGFMHALSMNSVLSINVPVITYQYVGRKTGATGTTAINHVGFFGTVDLAYTYLF